MTEKKGRRSAAFFFAAESIVKGFGTLVASP
jgi:hypothetical protein